MNGDFDNVKGIISFSHRNYAKYFTDMSNIKNSCWGKCILLSVEDVSSPVSLKCLHPCIDLSCIP